jgi:hypothetical protein
MEPRRRPWRQDRICAWCREGLLGHASIVLTADTYTSVLPQLYYESARATARLILKAARKTARKVNNSRPGT